MYKIKKIMEKSLVLREAVYTAKVENELLEESKEHKIEILLDENKLNEEVSRMKIKVNKEEFRGLFGKGSKPKKGDVVSIDNAARKYKVKKSKKFFAKKSGKGYTLTVKKEN